MLGQCAFDIFAPNFGNVTPGGVGQTVSIPNVWGGDQYTLDAVAGCNYTVSMCGTSWDTQLTIFNQADIEVASNDDFCGVQSELTFTAISTGAFTIQVNQWPCDINTTGAEAFNVTLNSCESADECNQPSACNYDPSSTGSSDCCYDNCVEMQLIDSFGDGWNGATYNIVDANGVQIATGTLAGGFGQIDQLCLSDGCYVVTAGGGGWDNEISWVMSDANGVIASGAAGSTDVGLGSSSGCTDPTAGNYDPSAICDDGSCLDCINPNPPGCPSIDLGADIVLPECVDPCLPLDVTADFFDVGSTTSYTVEAIDFCPPYPFTVGTPIFVGTDDVFSDVIPLPFDFCFYGNVFNQAVIGANGLISFNTALANNYCEWSFDQAIPSPEATLGGIYNNSINGAYFDIDPGEGGTISYAVLGASPCRTLVVNFNEVPLFSCTNLRCTQQIVLYETTNAIEVYIKEKPVCPGWNAGNSVIGLQNATGTMGVVPPGRQTGAWSASNEAWRFNPTGASIVSIEWFQQGLGVVGAGATLQVCPTTDVQTFVAEASYLRCDGVEVVVSDIVSVQCALLVLPVEWLGFDAKLISNDEEVLCSWQTATELENDYFTVQRSQDGFAWEDIGFVDGAGTSYDNHNYSYIDQNPYNGTSYYRIKQTDFNGDTDVTHRAVIMRSELAIFEAYPNPSSGKFTLSGVDGGILQVLDLRGRLVEEFVSFGSEIELSEKATGAYLLKYIARNGDISYARVQLD